MTILVLLMKKKDNIHIKIYFYFYNKFTSKSTKEMATLCIISISIMIINLLTQPYYSNPNA